MYMLLGLLKVITKYLCMNLTLQRPSSEMPSLRFPMSEICPIKYEVLNFNFVVGNRKYPLHYSMSLNFLS